MQNIPTKVDGVSTLPAAEFNQITEELENVITSSGQVLNGSDLSQISKAAALYGSSMLVYADSGSSNNKILTLLSSMTSVPTYKAGMLIGFLNNLGSTSAVTVDVSGLGVKNLTGPDGSLLTGGELQPNQFYTAWYTGAEFRLTFRERPQFIFSSDTALVSSTHKNSSIVINNSSNSVVVSLPSLINVPEGAWFNFSCAATSSSNFARVRGNGSESIETYNYYDFYTRGSGISVVKNNGAWRLISSHRSYVSSSLSRVSPQTLTSGVLTKVQLTGVLGSLQGGSWSNNTSTYRITPQIPGWYICTANATFAASSSSGDRRLSIFLNGSQATSTSIRATAGINPDLNCATQQFMNGSTDYFECFAYQDSGADLNISNVGMYVTLIERQM